MNHCLEVNDDPALWAIVRGGIEVNRDDDYLRELLNEFEASNTWIHHSSGAGLSLSKHEAFRRQYHILLLVDAGLMTSINGNGSPYRLTSQGHDFLAITRQSEAWEAAKSATRHMGGASIQMLYRVAEGYAREKLAQMGVPLGM
ncbi:hypothetical protein A8B82_21225 [Sulfitobacter sp. EhC04]|uniref:DUF2513 domain-containing protein n=1 Tax=Sulfitobacter sp. EhC04 TaxID=1849168 RepID=UPI0007F342B3|nr:DUF2513 domain-containing protein [Sulfitobacter sp. EhC04]OAN71117.1 hypothetical protein A8B82_21225 [Sulfitobacter sp. EhC04]